MPGCLVGEEMIEGLACFGDVVDERAGIGCFKPLFYGGAGDGGRDFAGESCGERVKTLI